MMTGVQNCLKSPKGPPLPDLKKSKKNELF